MHNDRTQGVNFTKNHNQSAFIIRHTRVHRTPPKNEKMSNFIRNYGCQECADIFSSNIGIITRGMPCVAILSTDVTHVRAIFTNIAVLGAACFRIPTTDSFIRPWAIRCRGLSCTHITHVWAFLWHVAVFVTVILGPAGTTAIRITFGAVYRGSTAAFADSTHIRTCIGNISIFLAKIWRPVPATGCLITLRAIRLCLLSFTETTLPGAFGRYVGVS